MENAFKQDDVVSQGTRSTMRSVNNADAAKAALQAAQPELMRGVTKGVVHKNTASRKISRLASRVKALSAV